MIRRFFIFFLLVSLLRGQQATLGGNGTLGGTASLGYRGVVTPPPAAFDIYVSPVGSDSTGNGSISQPYATMNKARIAAQTLTSGSCTRAHTIAFRGYPTYSAFYPKSSTTFTSADAAPVSCPVVYTNYPGEVPILSGGQIVTGWNPSTTGTCAPAHAASPSLTCYQAFISPTAPSGASAYAERMWYCAGGVPANCGARIRPRPCATAANLTGACGNSGYGTFGGNYGHSTSPLSGNVGLNYTSGDTVSDYAHCNLTSIHNCEFWSFTHWIAYIQRILSTNTSAKSITSTCGSNCPSNGAGVGAPYQNGDRYVIDNVQEELSYGGQFFLDQSTTPSWTLSYVANAGENPNTDTVILPFENQVVTASNLTYTIFSGLVFAHDNYAIPATGYLSTQLDPTLTNALFSCTACSNVSFTSSATCTAVFSPGCGMAMETTSSGVYFGGNSANDTIAGIVGLDCGAYCIKVGDNPNATTCSGGCTPSNVPRFITVAQNWIAGYGHFIPSADGIMIGLAHDISVLFNDVGFGYHAGMEACSPSGVNGDNSCISGTATDFNILIEGNDFHNIAEGITGDLGCAYIMTAYNLTRDVPAGSPTGNFLVANRCHDVNGSAENGVTVDPAGHGFYLDGATGNWTVEYNVCYRTDYNCVNFNFGPQLASQPNIILNNIFANVGPKTNGGCFGVRQATNCAPCNNPTAGQYGYYPSSPCVISPACGSGVNAPYPSIDEQFSVVSNVCSQRQSGQSKPQFGTGPPTTGSLSYQHYANNLYSLAGTPAFLVAGAGTVNFAAWQSTYGEDTGGTISVSPGYKAPNPNPSTSYPANTVPVPGTYDDFTFANGTGPGSPYFTCPGLSYGVCTNNFGPTARIAMPLIADTFPIAYLQPNQF